MKSMNTSEEIFSGRTVKPLHPGEVLADILDELEISQTKFAELIGVSRRTINQIVQGVDLSPLIWQFGLAKLWEMVLNSG